MKEPECRALVISDFDPAESKGAASVALNLARQVFGFSDFIYLCTTKRVHRGQSIPAIRFEYMQETFFDRIRDRARSRFPATEGVMRVIAIRRLWRIFWIVKKVSPQVIWVHQIGWRIPITSLLIFRALGVPIFITIHDYSFLRFRKIYPSDFDEGQTKLNKALKDYHTQNRPLSLKFASKPTVWQSLTRFIVTQTSEVIYISELQSSIYLSEGYPTGTVINTTVRPCNCNNPKPRPSHETDELNVLFAGRLIGKGLERLVDSLARSPGVHLHLAGGRELFEYANCNLLPHQFTYHGVLEEQELFDLIHLVDITSVLSTCFDVYPTITLESLAHGTPVISTPTTGNFLFTYSVDSSFALSLNGEIPFAKIQRITKSNSHEKNLNLIADIVTNNSAVHQYRSVFSRIHS
jgi:glycosyltransferase involved in cell wall biosynthesis